ncbi:maleylpyruvate isomerase family mycothiol-dependent enzyme [Kineococcus sp. T13]|uniref:maleylpyruvate isomerase family mycothiol-dependent enzyme n=1 Tax=Kineococcus vitellinus TaxID=2696565 RepID=UPI001412C317|nr:maleylpyruvate isomerase family mycothiol-dependent enzyme [Kineococcus vitellinus]NAZ77860.1 maleylpyruvate isomerase family mycothiol-dependent enzyme [Kineococcus vitellinus]
MTDPQSWVAPTCAGLADLLEAGADGGAWDAPSSCRGWRVRHVVAHVTMPVRLDPQRFAAEMAAAGGDFGVLSDTVAERDASLPVGELLAQLRSPRLHAWQPPGGDGGGNAAGALSHAVIHSLDVTIPLGRDPVAPPGAVRAVLEQLVAARGAWFGVDLDGVRLEATDGDFGWGGGRLVSAGSGALVALLSGRTLPDGRSLPRG